MLEKTLIKLKKSLLNHYIKNPESFPNQGSNYFILIRTSSTFIFV